MRGRRPAPAATQPQANAWKGVHGPIPPQNRDDSAMVEIPSRSPNRGPYARPARISRMKTASTPATPVLTMRTAAPTAVRTPSRATVWAVYISRSRVRATAITRAGTSAIATNGTEA